MPDYQFHSIEFLWFVTTKKSCNVCFFVRFAKRWCSMKFWMVPLQMERKKMRFRCEIESSTSPLNGRIIDVFDAPLILILSIVIYSIWNVHISKTQPDRFSSKMLFSEHHLNYPSSIKDYLRLLCQFKFNFSLQKTNSY